MGFIKWLYGKYREYKVEQNISLLEPSEKERHEIFVRNYAACRELGFSDEAILALMNLWSSM